MLSLVLSLVLNQAPAPKVELPPVFAGDPGSFITVIPTTNGKSVKYAYIDKGLNVFPSALLSNPVATVVTAPKGKYRLLAYTALGDVPSEPVITVINVGGVPDSAPFGPYNPAPLPPAPVPPTPPAPPTPPGPMPPNPPQPDALENALQNIYGGLQEKGAAEKVAKLAEIYREGARAADNTDTDPNTGKLYYSTVGDVYKKVNTLGAASLTNSDIYDIRDRIRVELNATLPKNATIVLDPNIRKALSSQFSRIANILENLK
jgi:hypothetical protein